MTRVYSHMMKPAGVGCVEWGSILRTKSYLDIIFARFGPRDQQVDKGPSRWRSE